MSGIGAGLCIVGGYLLGRGSLWPLGLLIVFLGFAGADLVRLVQ